MARKDSIDKLRSVALFSGCSQRDLQKVARASDELTLPAGSILMEQGDMGREAFVILEGTAIVRRNRRKVAELGAGESVGELSVLDLGPRTATVEAGTDIRVLALTARALVGLLDENPALARKMLASMAGRVRDLDRKIFG
ncbi:MAG: cyclic nucleotide-binding domain-containing protein [Actinomycetota bacterium]|jgi:CRP/FNR family transcriptional regulator, cyclic AMP receptor protein|nr:cyclic nucleotide-binding domain-containing protein [Actinomycetota bacterium]